MNEAATLEVFSKYLYFFVRQIQASWFNNVRVRILEQVRVCDSDKVGVRKNAKIGEPLDAAHVFAIGAGTVHGPAIALRRKELASAEFRAAVVFGDEAAPSA